MTKKTLTINLTWDDESEAMDKGYLPVHVDCTDIQVNVLERLSLNEAIRGLLEAALETA